MCLPHLLEAFFFVSPLVVSILKVAIKIEKKNRKHQSSLMK